VLVVFSDGVDTSSSDKLSTTLDEAIKRDVPIFSIGLGYSESTVEERQLKRLSEQSGGVAYFPGKKKEKLEAALQSDSLTGESRSVVERAFASVRAGHDRVAQIKHGLEI
jgi:hypothetical protein